MDGRSESAVSIIRMNALLDRGELLAQEPFAIEPSDYRPDVEASIVRVGIPLTLHVVDDLVHARSHILPQAEKGSYAPKLTQTDELIDWTETVQRIFDRIRALFPTPCAATFYRSERIKVLRAQPYVPDSVSMVASPSLRPDVASGTIAPISHHRVAVRCADGWLELLELQFPGKKPMLVSDLLNGRRLVPGTLFSNSPSLLT